MVIHLIDGTYELFRHFYGLRRFNKGKDKPFGAMVGVLHGVLQMIEKGATHIGVATDHIIESFRNELYAGYKTGEGIERVLLKQFHPLEKALESMGITVWAMTDLEADDALASAARIAAKNKAVDKVCIWTPDKDLAQSVVGSRVVQMDRKSNAMRDEETIIQKFGVPPVQIPDYLALTGDSADGYPGVPGIGKVGAVRLLTQYRSIEKIPRSILGDRKNDALLFKRLATLRTDVKLFTTVSELEWRGPDKQFPTLAKKFDAPQLVTRAKKAWEKYQQEK